MQSPLAHPAPLNLRRILRTSDGVMWVIALVFLFWHLGGALSTQQLAGWDLTSHYYLTTKMLEYLRQGHVSGYDVNWYAGYPLFILYPPLYFIVSLLPYFLTFGLIPVSLSFNLVVLLIPIFVLFGFYFAARVWLGKEFGAAALFFGVLFFALPTNLSHLSVGLFALAAIGLPASFITVGLAAFILGLLGKRFNSAPRILDIALLGILIACCILMHIMVTIFVAWMLLIFFFFRQNSKRTALVVAGLLALALSAWWWPTFLRSLPYSSGSTLGLPSWMADPLLVLFPGLFDINLSEVFTTRFRFIHSALFGLPLSLALPVFLLEFPLSGALFAICTVIGIFSLVRQQKYFLPGIYLSTLLLLPRNLLTEVFSDGLHTYRFIQPLFLFQILLSAQGGVILLQRKRGRSPFSQTSAAPTEDFREKGDRPLFMRRFEVGVALLALFIAGFYTLSSSFPSRQDRLHGPRASVPFKLHLSVYAESDSAQDVIKYFSENRPSGRIAVDTGGSLFRRLGSAHYFSSQFPLQLNQPIVPGLLAESALSAGYLNPTLFSLAKERNSSDYLLWARTRLLGNEDFHADTDETMLSRLELYGVEYIVAGLPTTTEMLMNSLYTTLVYHSGQFYVFKLHSPAPLVQESDYHPFLFINRNGVDFREFSEIWYSQKDALLSPVIYLPGGGDQLPADEENRIGGYIVSWNPRRPIPQAEYDFWAAKGKPVIILNANVEEVVMTSERITLVPEFGPWSGQRKFAELLAGFGENSPRKPLSYSSPSTRRIAVESGGSVLLNFTYSPLWKSENPEQNVFWATPSSIFIFGKGQNAIRFN